MPPADVRRDGRPLTLLIGFFDPFYAPHVVRLSQVATGGAQLVVALDDPPEPLIARAKRAEIVAALAMVDAVVLDANEALSVLRPEVVLDDREEDLLRTSRLCQDVWSRPEQA